MDDEDDHVAGAGIAEIGQRICDADRPGDIPGPGWWGILRRLGRSLSHDDIWLRAAGVAFCALFAAIPGAAVPVSLFGLIADPEAVHRPIEMLRGLLPERASLFLADQMEAIATTSKLRLGAGLGGAILAALWGAWSGISGLIGALNMAYGEHEGRGFLRRQLVALTLAVAAGLFGLLAFILVAVLPAALELLPLAPAQWTMISLARWPALALLMVAALGMLYRFAPCRRAAKWRWVSPGAAVATVLWLAGSAAFSYYVANIGSYNETFGALGILMLLLTWFYLTSFAVLLGAELNAELERQTARDTTEGPALPLGRRGAAVADTVARSM
jgi:membrane protein